jgi:predicted anti-sigma-YlaC factor YlaD
MTGPADCGEIRHALGVYVVGAIDPAERAVVDAHLGHCPECREELAGLAGLPALLGRVPVADVERMMLGEEVLEEPPAELLDSLLAQVSARRRARRWRTVAATAAAAVIAIGGGIAVGDAVTSNSGTSPQVTAPSAELATGSNAATGVDAAVYYTTSASGMTMKVQATGIAPGTHCIFWVNTKAGQNVSAGTWIVGAPSTWYRASSKYTAAQAKSFDISVGNHRVVTIPIS